MLSVISNQANSDGKEKSTKPSKVVVVGSAGEPMNKPTAATAPKYSMVLQRRLEEMRAVPLMHSKIGAKANWARIFNKKLRGIAKTMLKAYMGFKNPDKLKNQHLIPKDSAAWLEWLVTVAKKRIDIQYLTDKELKKVIIRARPNLSPYKKSQGLPEVDPDVPECFYWNEEQVGDWIVSMGWPQLRETFVKNFITGRRLILMDCSALNQMGMSDLAAMKEVAEKIRELLGVPPPNGMRAIMRESPFERFLRRMVYNGRTYDDLTFEKFCELEGYDYELLRQNKNALIPCTTEVQVTTADFVDMDDEEDELESEHSLQNAPTVEFLVRNALIRNITIDEILRDILESVFLPSRDRKYGKDMWGSLKRGIGEGYDDLHLYHSKDKLDFVSGVSHALLDELFRTVEVMNDISQLQKHIKHDLSKEEMELFHNCAQILVDDAAPIAAVLALGELDLETIFKQEPVFEKLVDEVIHDAEAKTNELVPGVNVLIDEVIADAFDRIPSMDLSGLTTEQRKSIIRMANGELKGLKIEKEKEEVKKEEKKETAKPTTARPTETQITLKKEVAKENPPKALPANRKTETVTIPLKKVAGRTPVRQTVSVTTPGAKTAKRGQPAHPAKVETKERSVKLTKEKSDTKSIEEDDSNSKDDRRRATKDEFEGPGSPRASKKMSELSRKSKSSKNASMKPSKTKKAG